MTKLMNFCRGRRDWPTFGDPVRLGLPKGRSPQALPSKSGPKESGVIFFVGSDKGDFDFEGFTDLARGLRLRLQDSFVHLVKLLYFVNFCSTNSPPISYIK